MKAGLAYNSWPLMDGRLVPDGLLVMQPWYLNVFENAMTVQFNHRIVAYVLTGLVGYQLWRVTLGTSTPAQRTSGLVHQLGAAILFSTAVWHLRTLRT